ncbi:SDR family NAD(P)-dependent oxidoreductase [Microbacterium dauci]|uniref:SDR family oxidoreductase n=1 Tax=Microbacterium dauci TaxID=3048008 RepID=A0ABT6ZC13_9MICO|nr:SDR family oxidoreductase [Microbacterium sp. LX3-4]MDJ1113177.1 SDR family oxidoreductase [Microbacterium sp. LX3-4]
MAVVITGASSGIGAGFARRFAERGHDLVLTARRAERLEALATDLRATRGVDVTVIPADLTDPAAPAALAAAVAERGIRVTGLVNSAGFGTAARFADEDDARIAAELQVNVVALTLLSRVFLPQLIETRGVLVNISSTAGHQPLPGLAVYGASKTYVTTLTEAIWQETRSTGLRVLALCPGPTETEFFEVAGSETFKVGRSVGVDVVLDEAFAALDRRDPGPVHTVGAGNRAQGLFGRISPRRLRLWVAARAVGGH